MLIQQLDQVAVRLQIPYFVIGATARDIVIEHVHGLETTRATRDVDFAVAVSSWEEFARLKEQLIGTGAFRAGEQSQRLGFGENGAYPLDLVPFDGVERNGEIAWPPKGDFVMNVAGYTEAYESALAVEIETGFTVKILSLPAMVVLKILAWNDRPERDKHASDVLLILRHYHQTGQFERLYDDEHIALLERHGYDAELAGAALLGRDARRDLASKTLAQVMKVFASEKHSERFIAQMLRSQPGVGDRATLLFAAFIDEIAA
ncbi:nucleotidyl transferase AbiEii/AbiGii toxin family protein [Massilia sp. Mn16-1_5]|uniref:nucleotidyl transferase AbiEii/AbiGii toxin family protein n=1 Tax=Massilia sp. Mn16-1_5 TaxID=2079199 RepID=UPI0014481907|nr:nucleotidyl transferase AbiEii/AbiGii toxin family protein [Massilia sp. Mn16-1_5]